jgi:hypothetical protein
MKTLTASTTTIVALDLGKYKSVACLRISTYNRASPPRRT